MTAQGVHASLQENFRSTWRNWKGGLLTRHGHRGGPRESVRSSFYGDFFRRAYALPLSFAPPSSSPRVPSPPFPSRWYIPTIVITFAILHLRGFPIARAHAHIYTRARTPSAPQFFLPLRSERTSERARARARLQTLFVTYRICVMQFVYFHECALCAMEIVVRV